VRTGQGRLPGKDLGAILPKDRDLGNDASGPEQSSSVGLGEARRNCGKFVTVWFNLHADMHITVLSVDFCDFTMTELHELSV